MQGIKKLLEKNPGLLRVKSTYENRRIKKRYEDALRYDKYEEVAKEYISWALNMPNWKVDYITIDKNFNFGKTIAKEYSADLLDIEKIFNEVLPQYISGGFLGFFISGMYNDMIGKDDILKLSTIRYFSSISGLGYQHRCGRLEITGDKTHYVGQEMSGGEIVVYGNAGNYVGKSMKGGLIYIEGNTRNWLGSKMEGGRILIKGNTKDIIGEKMNGGEIIIGGDAGYWIGEGATGGTIKIKENLYP